MPTSIRKKKKLSNQVVCVSNFKNVSKNVIFFSKIDFTQKNPKKYLIQSLYHFMNVLHRIRLFCRALHLWPYWKSKWNQCQVTAGTDLGLISMTRQNACTWRLSNNKLNTNSQLSFKFPTGNSLQYTLSNADKT